METKLKYPVVASVNPFIVIHKCSICGDVYKDTDNKTGGICAVCSFEMIEGC